jgi:hypothetical protein
VLGGRRRESSGFWQDGEEGERMEVWTWRTGEMYVSGLEDVGGQRGELVWGERDTRGGE